MDLDEDVLQELAEARGKVRDAQKAKRSDDTRFVGLLNDVIRDLYFIDSKVSIARFLRSKRQDLTLLGHPQERQNEKWGLLWLS